MMRLVTFALMLAFGWLPHSASARINPTLSEAERGIRSDQADRTAYLRVRTLKLDAHIVGRTADVTVEMLIASDSAEPYQANLAVLLPENAVVNGYTLDVGGRMIPGQLLEALKAREIYEDEVRAGIDPGLAEVAGNRFATRIFPIDAAHPRRFRLNFVTAFDPAAGIALPLERDEPINEVTATVTVDGYETPPMVRFAGTALRFEHNGETWNGTLALRTNTLREGLAIVGGTLGNPLTIARHRSGEDFFVVADGDGPVRSVPGTGGRLRIYWDRSVSHRDAHPEYEQQALARLVDAVSPSAIDLVTFASDRPEIATLAGASGLRAALERVIYRGASSLDGLDKLGLPAAERCILVFDGQVTIDRPAGFAPGCRLMVLTAAQGADGARLGRIAQRSGGALVRVAAPERIAEAASALAANGGGVIAVNDGAGRPLDFRALPAGPGRWLLVGPMPKSGEIEVRSSGGEERRYSAKNAVVSADAPGALWAVQRVSDLADDPAQHTAMAALARRYQVAGPAMSFLVLERPDQYLRAGLTPPPGFSDAWMQDYRQAKSEDDGDKADAKKERLAFVLEQWRERRDWWAKKFTPRPKARHKAEPSRENAPPPPPPPAPPPPPPAYASSPTLAPANQAPATVDVTNDPAADMIVTAQRRQDAPVMSEERPVEPRAVAVDLADLLTTDRPYLAALNAAKPAARLAVLAGQERAYGTVPTFYLDVAEWFRLKGDARLADLLLLSALELPTSDDETRQIVAFRLERDGHFDRAVELAEQLAAVNAAFRPQPARDLALALAARGHAGSTRSRADLERAFTLLTELALNPASEDFDGIEVIALMEANALIPEITAAGGRWSLDRRLVGLTDTDARVVIEWTANDADIDLWVDEPNGGRVYYSDKLSTAGGLISNDMTDGYGPEEYAIHRAPTGPYQVRVNGYDADRINPNGPGHVLVRLYRNFARPSEQQSMVDVDLSFQAGSDRNREDETRPVATLRVN